MKKRGKNFCVYALYATARDHPNYSGYRSSGILGVIF
jgi:hypothetical protein